MKTKFIVTALAVLLVANVLMMFVYPFGIHAEGFQVRRGAKVVKKLPPKAAKGMRAKETDEEMKMEQTKKKNRVQMQPMSENFQTYVSASAGGAGESYEPMGAYDNVSLPTGNDSSWRYTAPNEPLMGPAFEPGPDSLFMFKNNQCKPECCGASFSCDGGCVCTSPEQRQYIASRGGNRTAPEDSA